MQSAPLLLIGIILLAMTVILQYLKHRSVKADGLSPAVT